MTVIRMARNRAERRADRFEINRPLATHWRAATCAEVACQQYREGWITTVDERTALGQGQAAFIRGDRTRRHREERLPNGLTAFHFEPGQCFFASDAHEHRLPLEIDPLFEQHGRGLGSEVLEFPEWVDRFNDHMHRVAQERG